jgi:hypothetical protein
LPALRNPGSLMNRSEGTLSTSVLGAGGGLIPLHVMETRELSKKNQRHEDGRWRKKGIRPLMLTPPSDTQTAQENDCHVGAYRQPRAPAAGRHLGGDGNT